MLQKNKARQRRYQDQDWEEVISIYVGRRSRKNVWRYVRRVGNTAEPDHETTVLCWVASRIAAPRKPKCRHYGSWKRRTSSLAIFASRIDY